MRTFLLVLFLFPMMFFSQEESRESKLYRYWAQQERKKIETDTSNKLFYLKNELSFYINGEKIGEYQKPTYYAMVKSCNDIIKIEINDTTRRIYYDTLNIIQDKMEQLNFLDKISWKSRINWYSKGTKPLRRKIDSIFLDQMISDTLDTENYLIYYTNLYLLYMENKFYEDKIRLFDEQLNFVCEQYDQKDLDKITTIFNEAFKTEILQMKEYFWESYDDKVNKIYFISSYLENNNLITSDFYKSVLDTMILINPTSENYFKLANHYKKSEKIKDYEKTLEVIKSKYPQFKDELNYNECVDLYNSGSYKSAYNLAIDVGGKFKGQAFKIAAMSVANLADVSGSSTFERKSNYYYAIQLLEKAKSLGVPTSSLISQYKTKLPTSTEKFTEGNPKSILLTTWGVTVTIKP